jgi:hypothetical protein
LGIAAIEVKTENHNPIAQQTSILHLHIRPFTKQGFKSNFEEEDEEEDNKNLKNDKTSEHW